jgi:NDP-sugar pyrophosphorylase family protein
VKKRSPRLPNEASVREGSSKIDCVLLCAGRGRRFRPYTDLHPKVLVPIDSEPLLDYHLKNLSKLGFHRVLLVVGYRQRQIRSHVRDGSRFGLEVSYRIQRRLTGTGSALETARNWIKSDSFLVCYGDVWVPFKGWQQLVRHRNPCILASRVSDASELGRLETVRQGTIRRLIDVREKDGRRSPGLVNAGLYMLPASVFEFVDQLALSSRGERELPSAVALYSRMREPVEVEVTPIWFDVGDANRVRLASEAAQRFRIATT